MEGLKEFISFNNNSTGTDYGNGYGYGYGSGSGFDNGFGFGFGNGSGTGIIEINKLSVAKIDGIPTIISVIKKNVAKGFILNSDLTLDPCFVIKQSGIFAHGETLRKAKKALDEKLFAMLNFEEKIKLFNETFNRQEKYQAKIFFDWHGKLTGSCEPGRLHFVKQKGIDLDNDYFTVEEFIELTKNSHGGEIIQVLKGGQANEFRK